MIKWLWSLIWGPYCDHVWEIHQTTTLVDEIFDDRIKYILRCTECGKMKSQIL